MKRNNLQEINLTEEELVKIVCKELEDYKVEDIVIFDLGPSNQLASYIVIGTGTSSKHISSSADKLSDKVDEAYGMPQNIAIEGSNKNSKWILIDLKEVMVHLFTGEAREMYNLEEILQKKAVNSKSTV
jgi:ribosome-associated protein